jgi:deazaflavin-dependent oxidoreductase (nitroreductase family)
MSNLFRLFSNIVMKLILPSRLHRLFSKTTTLITVTGRKTGKAYTVPVDYLLRGNTVTIFSNKNHRWWRNLGPGASVNVCLRGKWIEGSANVETPEPEQIAAEMRALYPRMPEKQALAFAPKTVVIRVMLRG